MKLILVALFLAFLASPAAYAQTPTPTQAIIPAGGVQHVWTVDDVTGTTCVTSINERGTSGVDMIAVDQVNCGASTGGTPVPDGGVSLRVRNTPNDFYEAPTPVPTISPPYTVLTIVQSNCTGGTCSPQFMRNNPLMSINAGDKFRVQAGATSDILISDYPGMSVNAWTLMSVTVNGASSRHRIFQPAIGWKTENESVGTGVFADPAGSPASTIRWFANQAGNSNLLDGNWAATVVMKVDDADDPDIATVEQWLIDEYMITPTPTITGTPTPTQTPTNTLTPTPTSPAGLTCVNIPFQTYGELAFASSEAGWSSEASAATCDGATSYSQGSITSTSGYSNLLRASNLDLTGIPTDKTWHGFTVTVQASVTTAANYDDYVVQWIDGSSTLVGENRARSLPFTVSPTYETRTYGAQYDKWGNEFCITTANAACPNPAHINLNDSDVGIGLSVERLSSTTTAVRVSCITIEGCYLDNTPTPTITPTPGATDTPANTPTPTPTLDPPAAGCCRSEIYTVP